MKPGLRLIFLAGGLCFLALLLVFPGGRSQAQDQTITRLVTGVVFDPQNQPVLGAVVSLNSSQPDTPPLAQDATQQDGRYALEVPPNPPNNLSVTIQREHYQTATIPLDATAMRELQAGEVVVLPDTVLRHRISLSFWVARSGSRWSTLASRSSPSRRT